MQFKNYISNQDNLFPLSALISGAILLFVFIMTQILAYSSPEDAELLNKEMEIRELVKLKFAPQGDKLRKQSSNPAKAKISKKTGNALVKSEMKQDGAAPFRIDYVLTPSEKQWKIINIMVEGTNMRKSYKNQFLPRIKEIGMEQFLVELNQQAGKKKLAVK